MLAGEAKGGERGSVGEALHDGVHEAGVAEVGEAGANLTYGGPVHANGVAGVEGVRDGDAATKSARRGRRRRRIIARGSRARRRRTRADAPALSTIICFIACSEMRGVRASATEGREMGAETRGEDGSARGTRRRRREIAMRVVSQRRRWMRAARERTTTQVATRTLLARTRAYEEAARRRARGARGGSPSPSSHARSPSNLPRVGAVAARRETLRGFSSEAIRATGRFARARGVARGKGRRRATPRRGRAEG